MTCLVSSGTLNLNSINQSTRALIMMAMMSDGCVSDAAWCSAIRRSSSGCRL